MIHRINAVASGRFLQCKYFSTSFFAARRKVSSAVVTSPNSHSKHESGTQVTSDIQIYSYDDVGMGIALLLLRRNSRQRVVFQVLLRYD